MMRELDQQAGYQSRLWSVRIQSKPRPYHWCRKMQPSAVECGTLKSVWPKYSNYCTRLSIWGKKAMHAAISSLTFDNKGVEMCIARLSGDFRGAGPTVLKAAVGLRRACFRDRQGTSPYLP